MAKGRCWLSDHFRGDRVLLDSTGVLQTFGQMDGALERASDGNDVVSAIFGPVLDFDGASVFGLGSLNGVKLDYRHLDSSRSWFVFFCHNGAFLSIIGLEGEGF